jgi:hypothetical protein
MSGHEDCVREAHIGLVDFIAWDKELEYYRKHKEVLRYHGCSKSAAPEELVDFFENCGEEENFSCICDVDCKNCIFHYLDNEGNILERSKTPLCGTF